MRHSRILLAVLDRFSDTFKSLELLFSEIFLRCVLLIQTGLDFLWVWQVVFYIVDYKLMVDVGQRL